MALQNTDGYKVALTNAVRTGILKLQQKDLTAIPRAVFEIEKYVPEDNGWWELLVPHTLILTHNEITSLCPPQDLDWGTGWKELQNLNVAYNTIEEIPVEILCLELLRKLQCQHNRIRHITFQSTNSNLVHIELQHNALQSLGEDIGECVHLQHLNVSHNQLQSLPSSLFECCPKLEILEATNNRIAGPLVHIDFSKCQRLKECDLSNNRITAISSSMFLMPSLHRLSLRQNQISEIRTQQNEEKEDKSHLIDLYLGSNRISHCPCDRSLGVTFPALKLLDLSSNRLDAINPDITSCCPTLHRLDISGNNLQDIPAELSLLNDLTAIVAEGNPLRRINRSLIGDTYSLKNYLRNRLPSDQSETNLSSSPTAEGFANVNVSRCTELDLKNQKLSELPSTIGQMVNLCHLELDNNSISDLSVLVTCGSLKHLSAVKNQISDISPLFGLSNLEEVDLRVNRLRNFKCTVNGIWPKLQSLRLAFNHMADPSTLLQCIASPSVRVLDIGNNSVGRFPMCILEWPSLKVLDLSNNDLADIPAGLGRMKSINALMLSGNRLRRMRSVITEGNTQKILLWLRERISQ